MTTTERTTSEQLRSELEAAGAKIHELRTMDPAKRGESFDSEFAETRQTILSLDAEHRVALAREQADAEAARATGPSAALVNVGGEQYDTRSVGEQTTGSDEYAAWVAQYRGSGNGYGEFPHIETRELLTETTTATPNTGLFMPTGQPIPPIPRRRRLFIRDLLSTGATTLSAIPYIRELNPATNETGASATPEGSAKPEIDLDFESETANVRKIAAWVPATMEILEDAPTLRSYVDARLVYMVQVREELDLLNGSPSGVNPTVEGITVVSGTQTQAVVQSDSRDDGLRTLAAAIGKVENVDGEANGIAMNPLDYWAMVSSRFGTGTTGQMDAANPWQGPPGTVWGMPVVRTRALAQTDAIVADWRAGGQVFDRSGIVVRTSDSHDDYFVKNKIAILAEKRLAFAIYRPDFFVLVDIQTPGA